MMRSAPFLRLHSLTGCQTPPAATHSGCVPSAQLAPLHVPPTVAAVHTASVVMAVMWAQHRLCQRWLAAQMLATSARSGGPVHPRRNLDPARLKCPYG